MPARVGVADGIIGDIRVPIQSLRPAGDEAVRLGEASQGGVVVPGVVKHTLTGAG